MVLVKESKFDERTSAEYLKLHPLETLEKSLTAIYELKYLRLDLLEQSKVAFDSKNKVHEKQLLQLWDLLAPNKELTGRISKDWQYLGFQGEDPATDFRGMGYLGLHQLLSFAKNNTEKAAAVVLRSNHPVHWYSFAIVGINVTSTLLNALSTNSSLQIYMYRFGCSPALFDELYSYVMYTFDDYWHKRKPENILLFNQIFKDYLDTVFYPSLSQNSNKLSI